MTLFQRTLTIDGYCRLSILNNFTSYGKETDLCSTWPDQKIASMISRKS